MYAATAGDTELAKLLIEKKADLEQTSTGGATALMFATLEGNTEIGKLLVVAGADVNAVNENQMTALHMAIHAGNLDFVEFLLSQGADCLRGKNAMVFAKIHNQPTVARLLEQHASGKKVVPAAQNQARKTPLLEKPTTSKKSSSGHETVNSVDDLNKLIGLHEIKNEVNRLINFTRIQLQRRENGLVSPKQNLHLVFTGNPGTGKTTIARIVANVYKDLGILSKGHLIETDRSGLVAEYLGQTAPKVHELVRRALGGVLFIDEAYSLTGQGSNGDAYGKEAIDTLLKLMEDHRDDLIVIVAGYTEPMNTFINTNPGLQSRFTKYMNFVDYSPQELTAIFEQLAKNNDYTLVTEAHGEVLRLFERLYHSRTERFGNGRTARNMFEQAIGNHANRLSAAPHFDNADLTALRAEDIPTDKEYR